MPIFEKLTRTVRFPGDPKIIRSGPGSRSLADRTGKRLGWFSIALGLTELVGARRVTRALGIEGREKLVRAFGARELASGVTSLSIDTRPGIWSRVAGDALDLAALGYALRSPGGNRRNLGRALALVSGVAAIDLATGLALQARHRRKRKDGGRDYSDRSGWPKGLDQARAAARSYRAPAHLKAPAAAEAASPADGTTSPASAAIRAAL
jgi:hypothetical protein